MALAALEQQQRLWNLVEAKRLGMGWQAEAPLEEARQQVPGHRRGGELQPEDRAEAEKWRGEARAEKLLRKDRRAIGNGQQNQKAQKEEQVAHRPGASHISPMCP